MFYFLYNGNMAHRHIFFDGQKSITLDRWQASEWRNLFGDYFGATSVNEYYATVAFLFRCVTLRAGAVASLPWRLLDDRGEIVARYDDMADMAWLDDLPELINLAEAALCLSSRAYFYKERNRSNRVLSLKWWSPVAVEPVWDTYQGLVGFRRHVAGSHLYTPDNLVWLHLPNPLHETEPGPSPAQAAATDAGVLYSTDAFTKAFFDRGAIRATLLTVDGNPSPEDRQRLKSWWGRAVSGVKNAFTTEVFSSAVNPVQVGEGIQELANTALTTEKREGICVAMGVPLSLVMANAANYATAQVDERGFYTRTVIPAAQMIERRLNRQLFAEMNLRFQFTPQTLDIFREDEEQRSTAYVNYVNAGMKQSVAAEMLGLDLPVEYAELDPEAAEDAPVQAAEGKSLADKVMGYHIQTGVVTRDESRSSLGLEPLGRDTLGDIEAKLKTAAEAVRLGIDVNVAFGIVGLDTGLLTGDIEADDQAEEADGQAAQIEPSAEDDPVDDNSDDEDIQVEAAKFRRWLKKNPKRTPDGFNADYLTDATKREIYAEVTGLTEVKAMVLPGAEDGNDAARNELEQKHAERIAKAFRSVIRAIVPSGTTTENITPELGVQRLRDNFQPVRDAITTMLLEAGQLGVDAGIAQVETIFGVRKASAGGIDWNLANQAVIDWVLGGAPGMGEGYGDVVTQAMVQSRAEFIRASIAEWIQNGEPLHVLTEQLSRSFFSSDRAEMVAITEVTRAYAEGNIRVYMESGLVDREPRERPISDTHARCRCWLVLGQREDGTWAYQWKTSNDERVCPICGPKFNQFF